jgi:hypothetical protein
VLTYQERHLGCEDDLVSLKQASRCVCKHGVGDAVNQVKDALFDFFRWLRTVDGFLKDDTECL